MGVHVEPITDPAAVAYLEAFARATGATDCAALLATFENRPYKVLLSREPWPGDPEPDWRWHLSVTRVDKPRQVPFWSAMTAIAHAVRPGVPFVMGVPPRSLWLNRHEGCLHLWESKDAGLMEEWRRNASGHTPS